MITAQSIFRCCKSDRGTSIKELQSSAAYCEEIARNTRFNPWGDPATGPAYAEAAGEAW